MNKGFQPDAPTDPIKLVGIEVVFFQGCAGYCLA
jgi:hypothetical protein